MKYIFNIYVLLLIMILLQIVILFYVYIIKTSTALGGEWEISAPGYFIASSPAIVMIATIVYLKSLRK